MYMKVLLLYLDCHISFRYNPTLHQVLYTDGSVDIVFLFLHLSLFVIFTPHAIYTFRKRFSVLVCGFITFSLSVGCLWAKSVNRQLLLLCLYPYLIVCIIVKTYYVMYYVTQRTEANLQWIRRTTPVSVLQFIVLSILLSLHWSTLTLKAV